MFLNYWYQLPPWILLLFLSYLTTLLLGLVVFVPGSGNKIVRFLQGLKQVIWSETDKSKIINELVSELKKLVRETRLPKRLKIMLILILLAIVFSKILTSLL